MTIEAWIILIEFVMATVLSLAFIMRCNMVNRRHDEQIDEMINNDAKLRGRGNGKKES
jgi:hypothetical protein